MGPKATYILVRPGLQWGPGRFPGREAGGRDEVLQKLKLFCQSMNNFDVLENEYTKIDLSCTAMPIKNVTLAFLRTDFIEGLRLKPC